MKHPFFQKYITYIRSFALAPKTVGTIVPSSSYLCRSMVNAANWQDKPLLIAELGAGDGVLTKHILKKMKESDALYSYEINSFFYPYLHKITDPRFTLKKSSAEELVFDYDIIFSCLPFLTLPKKVSLRILKNTQATLRKSEGQLILFQYTKRTEHLLSRYFNWERKKVLKNIPPAYVYVCTPK